MVSEIEPSSLRQSLFLYQIWYFGFLFFSLKHTAIFFLINTLRYSLLNFNQNTALSSLVHFHRHYKDVSKFFPCLEISWPGFLLVAVISTQKSPLYYISFFFLSGQHLCSVNFTTNVSLGANQTCKIQNPWSAFVLSHPFLLSRLLNIHPSLEDTHPKPVYKAKFPITQRIYWENLQLELKIQNHIFCLVICLWYKKKGTDMLICSFLGALGVSGNTRKPCIAFFQSDLLYLSWAVLLNVLDLISKADS